MSEAAASPDIMSTTTTDALRPPGGQRGPRARACAECKRHKIRCELRKGQMACARCVRAGIQCLPHDPSQKIREENEAWKSQASAQILQLQCAVNALLDRQQLPILSTFGTGDAPEQLGQLTVSTSPEGSPRGSVPVTESVISPVDIRDHSAHERQADDPGLAQPPMNNIYELTKDSTPKARKATSIKQDPISRGTLSLVVGEQLFSRFMTNHHPLLWGGIIFPYITLEAVRRASTLLSTVIFTIAALHSPGGGGANVLQTCYDMFVSLTSASSLSRSQSLDDIRALCLGAFYLPNLSWRLSGQASRMAAEMNIHQSFDKLMGGDLRHAERVRLWYALFVCDHHFGIAYGRPVAMSDDDSSIRNVERFIECPSSLPGDIRVAAQVALFRILSKAHREYGTDQSKPLTDQELDRIRMSNIDIEQWRLFWQPRSLDAPGIQSYPSKGVVLYYHFARCQLNALALRGVRWPGNVSLSLNRREAVTTAVSAAMGTLLHVLEEEDMRNALNGVPLFTHTMVAFCATFLLKIAALLARGGDKMSQVLCLNFNMSEILTLTRRSADLLGEVADDVSEKHLARLVVVGIREMLQRVTTEAGGDQAYSKAERNGSSTLDWAAGSGAAVDFAAGQIGHVDQDIIYDMDLDSLAGFLEYDQYVGNFAPPEFDSWNHSAPDQFS